MIRVVIRNCILIYPRQASTTLPELTFSRRRGTPSHPYCITHTGRTMAQHHGHHSPRDQARERCLIEGFLPRLKTQLPGCPSFFFVLLTTRGPFPGLAAMRRASPAWAGRGYTRNWDVQAWVMPRPLYFSTWCVSIRGHTQSRSRLKLK